MSSYPLPRSPQENARGSVSREVMAQHLLLPAVEDIAVRRAFKILRTRILQRLEARNWSTVGVTGTTAGEGKTFAAINLALALVEDVNTRVFLVDLDLQRPKVARYLGMSCDQGISDYLAGEAQLQDVIYDTDIPRFAVIPSKTPLRDASDMLRSPRLASLVRTLRQELPRRVIIFDLPPLLGCDDVLAFAPEVDSFLLVVSQGQTQRRCLANARELLAEIDVIGVVLNRSTEHNDSRYY